MTARMTSRDIWLTASQKKTLGLERLEQIYPLTEPVDVRRREMPDDRSGMQYHLQIELQTGHRLWGWSALQVAFGGTWGNKPKPALSTWTDEAGQPREPMRVKQASYDGQRDADLVEPHPGFSGASTTKEALIAVCRAGVGWNDALSVVESYPQTVGAWLFFTRDTFKDEDERDEMLKDWGSSCMMVDPMTGEEIPIGVTHTVDPAEVDVFRGYWQASSDDSKDGSSELGYKKIPVDSSYTLINSSTSSIIINPIKLDQIRASILALCSVGSDALYASEQGEPVTYEKQVKEHLASTHRWTKKAQMLASSYLEHLVKLGEVEVLQTAAPTRQRRGPKPKIFYRLSSTSPSFLPSFLRPVYKLSTPSLLVSLNLDTPTLMQYRESLRSYRAEYVNRQAAINEIAKDKREPAASRSLEELLEDLTRLDAASKPEPASVVKPRGEDLEGLRDLIQSFTL